MKPLKIFSIQEQNIYIATNNYVEFSCGGAGREYYTGILYSDNGDPIGLEYNLSMTLTKEEKGWIWEEEGGDNHYYCENIIGNWYYYQMWW